MTFQFPCHFSGSLGAIPRFRNCKCCVVSVGWFQCDDRLELPNSWRNSRSIHHWKRPIWINKQQSPKCLLLCILILQLHIKKTTLDSFAFPNSERTIHKGPKMKLRPCLRMSATRRWCTYSISKPILSVTTEFLETSSKVSFYTCLSKTQHLSWIEVEQSKSSRHAHCDHSHLQNFQLSNQKFWDPKILPS